LDSIINKSAFFIVSKGKPGGAERRFFYLYEYYLEKGNEPHLIINSELLNSLSKDKLFSKSFSSSLEGRGVIAPLKFIFNSLRYIRANNIQHVHYCVNPSFYSFLMIFVLRFINCKSSVSIVNSIIRSDSDLSPIKKLVWKKTIENVDFIDTLSPSIRHNMSNIFGEKVFDSNKVSISSCSFSMRADLITKDKKRTVDLSDRPYDFVFASRLIKGKGLELLMEALRLCELEGHRFSVAICGIGPLSVELNNLKFKNVKLTYLGYVKDVSEVLFLSKVALSLQEYENYPSQFLLEALAANCNIISTDVGDTRLLLNQDIASLIKGDVLSLKKAMTSTNYDNSSVRIDNVSKVLKSHSVEAFAHYISGRIIEKNILK
jgi:glycosyltransferase involved in cell wall biosynthesis